MGSAEGAYPSLFAFGSVSPTQPECGAVSLLFIAAGLPFLLVLLVVGMEVSQFFGAREALQEIVDQEAHASLHHGFTREEVAQRIESRLGLRVSQVTISHVVTHLRGGASTVTVGGSFHGVLSEIFGGFVEAAGEGIAFELRGDARRARLGMLVVLDRGVSPGATPCNDPHLALRREFVVRLIRSLRESGAPTISVGVVPGEDGSAVSMLGGSFEVDGVTRCGASGEGDPEGVLNLAAAIAQQPDPLEFGYDVLKHFGATVNADGVETGSLVMVSAAESARTESSVVALSLLEGSIAEFDKPISAIALAEGSNKGEDPFPLRPGGGSGLSRYIVATETDLQRIDLVSVITGHLNGTTFLSQ